MSKKALAGIMIVIALTTGGIGYTQYRDTHPGSAPAVEEYTRLDIELEGGRPTKEAATYLVQPGVGLEFHIQSDRFGKISVPTQPPQTITFTESPLVFKFNASRKPGSYALLYLADKSDKIIQIGTIVVRSAS